MRVCVCVGGCVYALIFCRKWIGGGKWGKGGEIESLDVSSVLFNGIILADNMITFQK